MQLRTKMPEIQRPAAVPARHTLAQASNMYRVRFRFWVQKKLNLEETELPITVAGKEIVVSAQLPGVKIADSEWLVMNARAIEAENEAVDFARRLKASTELSSVIARLGINAGVDKPTSVFGKSVADGLKERHDIVIRNNVHGIDVFADDPNIRIGMVSATATVHSSPDPFLCDIDEVYKVIDGASPRARDIILLMNYALTRTDPVAMIMFAVSAVEMLGQDEKWSDIQIKLLSSLADTAERSCVGTDQERHEVAAAIRRSIHKLSLRQGVFRLLATLKLSSLRGQWDELYSERSKLVHGLAPKPGHDYGDLANKTMSLCGRILLTAVAREVPGADKYLDRFYPVK